MRTLLQSSRKEQILLWTISVQERAVKTIAILALLFLIMTSGQGVAADTCAPALDFEKRRLAADEASTFAKATKAR